MNNDRARGAILSSGYMSYKQFFLLVRQGSGCGFSIHKYYSHYEIFTMQLVNLFKICKKILER